MTHRLRAVVMLLAVLTAGCAAPPAVSFTPPSTASPRPSASRPATAAPTPADVPCPQPAALPTASNGIGRPAVSALLDLFGRSPIVALGERHGWQAEHDLLAQVVCSPRFPDAVDAVVVEFGNRRLQPILDRYVNGEAVTTAELASVWRESTQRSGVWEHPAYARFFGLIRTVNAGLPVDDRIRVLAGDPPIDYSTITKFTDCSDVDPACYEHWIQGRDESFADVVLTNVLARGERALLIAGSGHMTRRFGDEQPPSVPQLIEAQAPGSVFVILPGDGFGDRAPAIDQALRAWPVPGLAAVAGTAVGELDACLLEEPPSGPDAPACPTADGPRVQDVLDGYLLLEPVA